MGVTTDTKSIPWVNIGTIDATAAAADTALGATERTFQDIKDLANVVWFFVPKAMSKLQYRMLLTTDDADVDIDIWSGKVSRDPGINPTINCCLQRKGTLDVIAGKQEAISGKLFADTLTVSNEAAVAETVSFGAADHMRINELSLGGDNLVVFHGYGTFDEDCQIEISGRA